MNEFYCFLQQLKMNSTSVFALATVTQVDGSAYRHVGAKMLFAANGERYGLISGGCLEDDLAHHATEVIASFITKSVSYDLRSEDDLGWGQGAGCNGKIKVFVEPLQWNDEWSVVMELLDQTKRVLMVNGIEGEYSGARLFLGEDGSVFGNVSEESLVSLGYQYQSQLTSFQYLESETIKTNFTIEWLEPDDILYIFGGGPDVEPIVARTAEFGFKPVVIDPREDRCQTKYFPKASLLVSEHPERFLEGNNMKANSYVLIMTHSFMKDQKILEYFLENQPKYLGILGPRRRTERLIDSAPIPSWVHSPIGLDIHAEGAEEISISVLAELIKVRHESRQQQRGRNPSLLKTNLT